jgi:glycosyltransferase involved in cell wall biosynthesis
MVRRAQRALWSSLQAGIGARVALPQSDGTVERLGADIVHFPAQQAYLTNRPSIYHPHDLQHLHIPEFFDKPNLRWRESAYRVFCARAKYVSVESSWVKRDLMEKIGVPAEAIAVCPILPPTLPAPGAESTAAADAKKAIGFERFIFYPAQTWPHKNHLALIDALAILKQRFGLQVPLVCTGKQTEHYAKIAARIDAAGLAGQSRFLGYVSDAVLAAIYRMATAVVLPTLFESLSLPMWEAFAADRPVACSRVTALPEQLAGAGLLFDPRAPEDIAKAIRQLWESDALRADLARKGASRLKQFSSDRMIRHIRALYRQALGRGLTEDDRALLAAPALI